jgi:hexokinase
MRARGHPLRFTVLNDTVAVLLAGKNHALRSQFSSYVGFILGTGTNTAYVEQNRRITKCPDLPPRGKQAVNVESGNFALCPHTEIDAKLDAGTINPGEYVFEKKIAGAYLGRLSLRLLKAAAEEGLYSPDGTAAVRRIRRLSTAQADRFLRNPMAEGPLGSPLLTGSDRETTRVLIQGLIGRAALLAAVSISAAVLKSGSGRSAQRPVCVNADGSTFTKTSGLRSQTEGHLRRILGARGISFVVVEEMADAPLVGAAVAGLTRG